MNSAPFTVFPEFLENLDLDADGPLGPTSMTSYTKGQRRLAEKDQRGSFFAADAVAQVVPLGLTADDHFSTAASYARKGKFPMDGGLAVEKDLQCAAAWVVTNMDGLPAARLHATKQWSRLPRDCNRYLCTSGNASKVQLPPRYMWHSWQLQ